MDMELSDSQLIIPDPEEERSLGGTVFEGEDVGRWYHRISDPEAFIAEHLKAINDGVCYG